MRDVTDLGVEDLSQFVTPPRVKIVQKQASAMLLERFTPGDVIIVPQQVLVAPIARNEKGKVLDTGVPFFFTPVFFFPEWCLWNPIKMKGSLPAIRERSLDPKSPIAVKSKSVATWKEPCPENRECDCRYVEHLNFVCVLASDEHELAGTPIVLSFSRAEHKSGSNLASLIKLRRAPIYGCQFMGVVGHRTNSQGDWFGIDAVNPAGDSGITPFVMDETRFKALAALHEEMRTAHESAKIRVDYDEAEEEAPTADSKGEF